MLCNRCKVNPRIGSHTYCRECRNASKYLWRKQYPERYKAEQKRSRQRRKGIINKITHPVKVPTQTLLRKYGLTNAQYKVMYDEQNGKCFICLTPLNILSVDHDHETGKVRGLLCRNCNFGLGNFKDSPLLLEKAIIYLQK